MTGLTPEAFRQRSCRAHDCGAIFWICRSCDRGHAYCSVPCRERSRLQQRREANRRHQQSPEGRLDHRDRQRSYRKRQIRACVTDQRRQTRESCLRITPAQRRPAGEHNYADVRDRLWPSGSRQGRVRCLLCGRASRFVNPYP